MAGPLKLRFDVEASGRDYSDKAWAVFHGSTRAANVEEGEEALAVGLRVTMTRRQWEEAERPLELDVTL